MLTHATPISTLTWVWQQCELRKSSVRGDNERNIPALETQHSSHRMHPLEQTSITGIKERRGNRFKRKRQDYIINYCFPCKTVLCHYVPFASNFFIFGAFLKGSMQPWKAEAGLQKVSKFPQDFREQLSLGILHNFNVKKMHKKSNTESYDMLC